jgi:hypothetical protein
MALFPDQKSVHFKGKGSRPMKGTKEYKKFGAKEPLTRKQAIFAHCFDCMGFYVDGYTSCKNPACALYAYMPKREVHP